LRSSAEGRGTDHALEQSELSVLRGPDQVAGQSYLQARCKAQPVHGGDGGDLDLRESPDRRHEPRDQLPSGRFVAPEKDLDIRSTREVGALGTHKDRPRGAIARLLRRAREVA
jgi:hypothetical protein